MTSSCSVGGGGTSRRTWTWTSVNRRRNRRPPRKLLNPSESQSKEIRVVAWRCEPGVAQQDLISQLGVFLRLPARLLDRVLLSVLFQLPPERRLQVDPLIRRHHQDPPEDVRQLI